MLEKLNNSTQFRTVKLYSNPVQAHVFTDITVYLQTLTHRDENPLLPEDALRGALVAAAKFGVQTYYEKNRRQFTREMKNDLVKQFSDIIEAQVNNMVLEQVFAS